MLRIEPDAPVTDWISYHIYGMILLQAGSLENAMNVFENGATHCVGRQRDYFTTALAIARVRRGSLNEASIALDNVIWGSLRLSVNTLRVHIDVLEHETERAHGRMKLLPDGGRPTYMIIRRELERRLTPGQHPDMSDEKLLEHEIDLLIDCSLGTAA